MLRDGGARCRSDEAGAAVLGFEDAILLLKVGDHLLLVPIDPAGDHGDEEAPIMASATPF